MHVGRFSPLVISRHSFLLMTSTRPPFSVTSTYNMNRSSTCFAMMGMRLTGVPRVCRKLNKLSRNSFLLGSASSLLHPVPVAWWLQLRCSMGSPSGASRASPRALLATQCPGSTVTAEGLEQLSLAGEQGCGVQAGGARRPRPLLILTVLLLLVPFVVPQAFLQLLLLLVPFWLQVIVGARILKAAIARGEADCLPASAGRGGQARCPLQGRILISEPGARSSELGLGACPRPAAAARMAARAAICARCIRALLGSLSASGVALVRAGGPGGGGMEAAGPPVLGVPAAAPAGASPSQPAAS